MDRINVLVCGGRDFTDYLLLRQELDNILSQHDTIEITSGMAKGADTLAVNYAIEHGLILNEFHANWEKYGKKAGPIRNMQMLVEGKPDLVVAFPTKSSRGTWHMIRIAQQAGVETIVIGP